MKSASNRFKAWSGRGALFLGFALLFGQATALFGQPAAPTWTQLGPAGGPPGVRVNHSAVLNAANNRMIVFGGLNGPGVVTTHPMFNDVWVLSGAGGPGEPSSWSQLSPTGTPPAPRGYHSAAYDASNNRMIVFAGDPNIGSCNGAVNDVWVLAGADGTGGTPNWTQLSPAGGPPELRQGPSAAYDPASNRLIVFGGKTNACGSPSNAVWVLSNANGLGGTPVWTMLAPVGGPPTPRAFHTAVYRSASNRMVVFGGETVPQFSNDVWVLENANGLGGTPAWTPLSPTGGPPAARYFASAVYDPGPNRMVVFGGLTAAGRVDGVWVLENATGLGGAPNWVLLGAAGVPPSPRDAHTAVLNTSTNKMVLFAGRTCTGTCGGSDTFALNDVWELTNANGIIAPSGTAPTLSYTPPPGTQIALPGGALNAPVTSGISIESIGGTGAGQVQVACSVGAPFVLPAGDAFLIKVGDPPATLTVGCTLGSTEQIGNATCVETDSPGGAMRVRDWPLYCPAGSAATIAAGSELGNRGGAVAIAVSAIGNGVVYSVVGDMVFDKTRLTPTQVAARNGGNCFLRAFPNDDTIRFSVPTGPTPLAEQETTYCNVVFLIASDAPIDSTPLTLSATTCLNGANAPATCLTIPGNVAVSAFDSLPRPGSALSMVALPGQSSVSTTIVAVNFGGTAIDVTACTPDPATGFSITPSGFFSIPAINLRPIGIGCTPPAAGLPPRVTDLSCLLRDTTPERVVRYRLVCSTASSLGPIPGSTLSGSGTASGDEVGSALASTIAANGDEIMVIGAPFAGADDGGRAFVIVRPAGSDLIGAKVGAAGTAIREGLDLATAHALSAPTALGDKFGNAVAINAAGDRIAVGAPLAGGSGAGRVFVFQKPAPPAGWTTLDTPNLIIDAPTGAPAENVVADDFGAQLAYTANDMLIVGAPRSDVGVGAADAGVAFGYAPDSDTTTAIVRAPLVETGAQFGGAIAGNGGALAIGAPFENTNGNADQGAVYVMSAPGEPAETTRKVTATASSPFDKFGTSVAFVNRTLVVGAPEDDTVAGSDAGSATVFSGNAAGGFTETVTLIPAGNPGQQGGAAVATNGDVILLGAPFATVAGRPSQGRVFAYDVPESVTAPAPAATIIDNATGQGGDRFGAFLAASPRRLLIGAPKDDNELGIGGTTVQIDEGRADPFLFDRISRSGFE